MSSDTNVKGSEGALAKVIDLGAIARHGGGRPWVKGQSGNPKGNPKGTKTRKMLAIGPMKKLKLNTTALMQKAIDLALGGDVQMLQFLLRRVLPAERLLALELPRVKTSDDALEALNVVTRAVAEGLVTPAEASNIGAITKIAVDVDAITRLRADVEELQKELRERAAARS
jgi:hypothetical protein